jgi:hypothetical protein
MEQRDSQTVQNNIYKVHVKHIPANILTPNMGKEKQKESPGIG